ncbi:hypothetical protein A1O1_07507 [Capronia coronata CBS 617.96]|uniref:Uncharacterized protein n=1 Tax=Capronia coronata CBS 617.96 TaxID=1182541 RepID=W9YNQ6_9EURO|nr:uncharacterized protein A1O1_07507 [Capronia coronata CBS 617.96]EXJ83879.1 hypothetical protein A1O1_07507 [Capronia coronata CBS 617.96]
MPPPTTLVPSKNALRALRHLALSTPSVLVGTVGSICGVAALSYETCRRVRVAEKIVETKRILRSVSSGRGPAQLDALFEAAERGEDFTLQSRSTRKKRRKPGVRSLSTAAAPHHSDDNYKSRPHDIVTEPDNQSVHYPRHQSALGGHVSSDQAYKAATITTRRVPGPTFRKVAIASKEEHGRPHQRVYNHPTSPDQAKAKNFPGCVERWLTQGTAESKGDKVVPGVSAASNQVSTSVAVEPDDGYNATENCQDTVSINNLVSKAQNAAQSYNTRSPKVSTDDTLEASRGVSRRSTASLPGHPASDVPLSRISGNLQPPPNEFRVSVEKLRSQDSHSSQRNASASSPAGVSLHTPPSAHRRPNRPKVVASKSADQSRVHKHGLSWTPLLYPFGAAVDESPNGSHHQAGPSDLDLKRYLSETKNKRSEDQVSGFSIPHHLVMSDADEPMEQALRDYLGAIKGAPRPSSLPPASSAANDATQTVDQETLSRLMNFIHPSTRRLSKLAQFRRWTAVLRHEIQKDGSPDWLMAEAVFHAARGLFSPGDALSRPVFDLLRHLLSTEASYERARAILFPTDRLAWDNGVAGRHAKDHATDLPTKYLTLFCEQVQDYSVCIEEMAKVIKIAQRSGQEPSEQFAMPVLRAIVRAGDIEAARSLLDELDSIYELRNTQRLWGEYAVWNAGAGNWEEAQWILDRMQETGYSRHQPEQYASIFHRMLLHYLSKNTAHRTFGFAINAIKYTGLIPTGRTSRTIICACIREHRYDLVYEWSRLVSEAFPRLTSGFMTANGAWQLAHALQKAGASCRDIADTCRAIAHGCYDDPFPHYLRPLLVDLVKLDLSRRLEASSALSSEVLFSRDGTPLMTMDQLLQEARRFCTSPTPDDIKATTIENVKRDLAVQLDAVEELTRVFRGDVFMPDLPDVADNEESQRVPTRRSQISETRPPAFDSTFPDVLKQDKLPGYKELSAAVMNFYAARTKHGLPLDHAVLKYLIDKVVLENPADALTLIEQIYESEYVQGMQGVPFDNDIFVKWLQVVTTLGSVKAASTVLWAVVDSSRHIKWTLDFSFCLNIVTYICIGSAKGKQKALLTPEMFYLGRRLWWTRLRSPGHVDDDFEFPKWRPWELALRDAVSRPS